MLRASSPSQVAGGLSFTSTAEPPRAPCAHRWRNGGAASALRCCATETRSCRDSTRRHVNRALSRCGPEATKPCGWRACAHANSVSTLTTVGASFRRERAGGAGLPQVADDTWCGGAAEHEGGGRSESTDGRRIVAARGHRGRPLYRRGHHLPVSSLYRRASLHNVSTAVAFAPRATFVALGGPTK